MNKELLFVIDQIGREKGIEKEILFVAIESALMSASRKCLGGINNLELTIDRKTGEVRVYCYKKVSNIVNDMKNEISLDDARKYIKSDVSLEENIKIELTPQNFGRIAAQTAKQVILQKVREAEREGIYQEYKERESQIIRGSVHRIERNNLIIELEKTECILPEREQIPGEKFKPGDRIKAYLFDVRKTPKGPQLTLSRTHPGFLIKLFEMEVPEIQEGIVVIMGAVREPGERAKIAVRSTKKDIDPVGSCVGMRGLRIQSITRELKGERIDVIEWSENIGVFVSRALSPATVSKITYNEEQKSMNILVPDDKLSLAIGKKGQNARLAARLTGIKIDIKSESEYKQEIEKKDVEVQN